MSTSAPNHHEHHVPAEGEPAVPEIEDDETVAPRPEEEAANYSRSAPDTEDHGHRAE